MSVYSPDLVEAQEEYLQLFGTVKNVSFLSAEGPENNNWQLNDLKRSTEVKLRL